MRYGLNTWTYSARNGDPLTGLVRRLSAPESRITVGGRCHSSRSVLWQLREYEAAMLDAPAGMESMAAAYGAHIAGLRVVA